MLKST